MVKKKQMNREERKSFSEKNRERIKKFKSSEQHNEYGNKKKGKGKYGRSSGKKTTYPY